MDIHEEMTIAFPEGYGPQVALSKGEINALPLYAYEGRITLVDNQEQQEEVLNKLEGVTVIGFDTETDRKSVV